MGRIYGQAVAPNIDLSDTQRSPGQLPTRTPLPARFPFTSKSWMDQIRAKAKQALPAAPVALPPGGIRPGPGGYSPTPATSLPQWVSKPINYQNYLLPKLAVVGLVGYLAFFRRKKGSARG